MATSEKELHRPRRAPSPGTDSADDTLAEGGVGRLVTRDKPRPDGKVELTEQAAYEKLGFCYPTFKKWRILCVIFLVQVSMNMNTSLYANGVIGMSQEFGITQQKVRVGQMIFLVMYGLGCELWAAPSEELGRRPIMQSSLMLVNIFQLPCALAPNFASIVCGRFLGGLSSAGGSVTLGMVADMWEPDDQQWAIAFVVLSSVGGSVVGPIIGGFIQGALHWRWVFWIQLIFGGFVQILHFFLVPETRSTVLLDREARRRRKSGEDPNCYGPNELKLNRFAWHEVFTIMCRPFVMFVKEPVVLCLSLLSGFSDSLIFTFLDSFGPVFSQWGFTVQTTGLCFIALGIAYCGAYALHVPDIQRQIRNRKRDPTTPPEDRMWVLQYIVPLEAIGLMGFAWTSLGPEYHVHWIAPLIFAAMIGVANYSIYFTTIDYMSSMYGIYSASACGGNGMARDILAGIAAMYATPFYHNIGRNQFKLVWPTFILSFIGALVAIPVYVFVHNGPYFRKHSHFAQTLAAERALNNEYNPAKKRNAEVQHVEEAQVKPSF